MVQAYDTLLNSYQRMFGMVDAIHFNSQNTADVYGKYISVPKESVVVPITHGGVNDHRVLRQFDNSVLRLGFVGGEAPYKGLPMLKRVIERLNRKGFQDCINLSVYGGRTGADACLANVEYRGRFSASQMENVYDSMDLLVVPSIWCETFSLTTIEALQFGVPVLVSSLVGAKDIVKQYAPDFVFAAEENLFEILHRLINSRDALKTYNKQVVSQSWQMSMVKHAKDIENLIYKGEYGEISGKT